VIDILHGSLSLLQTENIGLNNAIQAREITEKRHYIETDESAAMISFFGPERSHKDSLGFRFLSHLLSVGFNGALAKSIERQMGIYDWQLAVGSTDSGFTLHLYYRDEKNQPHIFAEQFFKVLELFKNRLVSDVELHRAKNLAKNDLFALESKKVIQAMEIASDSMGDYRYVLESDYLSYIDSLTREDVQELCKKYLDLNSYHYHSVEPLSNKNSGDISVTEFDIEGLQVILEEDPNQDVIGVSWSYELVENSHPLIPYVGAWSLCEGPLTIENKTLEEKLSELSQLFHGAPMSDRLYFSGQITPNQWGEEFLALLPYLLLDRVVNQEHVKHSVTRVEEQMSQSSEDRWSDDWFYKEIFPDSQFMHPYLYDVNHLSSVKFPAVYEYVRSLLKLHRIRLVISGNFHKENVRNSLQNYFTSFSKLNKRVFPAGIDRQDGKTSIKQKMKSLYSRFSDKLKRKSKEVSNTKQPKDCDKTLVVDGEHFYQFIGDVYDAEEFRVEEEAAFVLLGLSLDNEVYDGVTFKDFEVSLSYDLTGEHLRALLKVSGLNKDRKQILDHVENILKECAGEIEADSSALDFVRKQVRLKKAYTMQDRAARAFWMNRAVSTGLGQSYGARFLEALKKLGHQDIKAIFKKRFQRKYKLLYAPVK
jgi:predicted Zn-dependent peptidase